MGKGNWERRAAMAAVRREQAREKKKTRNETKSNMSLNSIICRLISIERISGLIAYAWLRFPSSSESLDMLVCKEWFRVDNCKSKKCKYSHHGIPVWSLRGMDAAHSYLANKEKTELGCEAMVPLTTLPPSQVPQILFLSLQGQCVYDYQDSEVWGAFWAEHLQSTSSAGLGAIDEDDEGDPEPREVSTAVSEDSMCSKPTAAVIEAATPTAAPTPTMSTAPGSGRNWLLGLSDDCLSSHHAMLCALLAYLSFDEMRALLISASCARLQIAKYEYYHQMRKQFFSKCAIAAKKTEQKKKTKSSWLPKNDKKDGFARGMR